MLGGHKLVVTIVVISPLLIIAILALIYSLPILCIRRFQHRNNIFALNVCVTTILTCIGYALLFLAPLGGKAYKSFISASLWLIILQFLVAGSMVFSFVLVALHRCCSILYPRKRFFRSKQWVVVCLISQWIVASILCTPVFINPKHVRLTLVVLFFETT